MRATLKLFASLSDYLPPEARRTGALDLDLEPETTLAGLVVARGLPPEQCRIVLLNGVFVPERERAGRTLSEGDVVAIWPPVAGG